MQSRRTSLLFVLVGVSVFVAALHSQGLFVQPELLSGEWETTTASGVHGIHLYDQHRQRTTAPSSSSPSPFAFITDKTVKKSGAGGAGTVPSRRTFDGVRLRVSDLDVTFDSNMRRWTGTWLLDGETKTVVLEKPTCRSHPLCGTWEGRGLLGLRSASSRSIDRWGSHSMDGPRPGPRRAAPRGFI